MPPLGTDDRRRLCRVETTAVRFRELAPEEISAYVATGEPLDKAGSYGIQGRGGALAAAVDGSRDNVVGLPVERLAAWLRELGIDLERLRRPDGRGPA